MDNEIEEYLARVKCEHEDRTFFLRHNLGAEVHWFFTQGVEALKQGLILPACSSFIIGIEASLRVTLTQVEKLERVEELDPLRTLSNRLITSAKEKGLPIENLAFPGEDDFDEKLDSKKPNLKNVEIVRIRHNLCHGNILEYINTELGEDNGFFTPECCLDLARNLLIVSKKWSEGLGKYRREIFYS